MLNHVKTTDTNSVLDKNKSCFYATAYHNSPGFLGFFKSQSFLALCFINCERFENDKNLKNHALHLAWHAVSLHTDFLNKKKETPTPFLFKNNILTKPLQNNKPHHQNLKADIFSASAQTLQKNENALQALAKQRMMDTLTPKTGFQAENFPFPICMETLNFLFENKTNQFKKTKKPIIDSVTITNNLGKTYESESIEQWINFSRSAQILAWQGHTPETILGTAIYTAENTYDQSIADMIAEHLEIKPDFITNFNAFNPFTEKDVNKHLHKKTCMNTIQSVLDKIDGDRTDLFYEVIEKQNTQLTESSPIGWCADALIKAAHHIEKNSNTKNNENLLLETKKIFEDALDTVSWDILVSLSIKIFEHKRSEGTITQKHLINICETSNAYTPIHNAYIAVQKFHERKSEEHENQPNITDFISENYAQKSKTKTTF